MVIESLAQAHLEAVIVELASELVVVLCNCLTSSSSALSKHGWKIGSLRVDLLFTSCFTHVAFESMWVNYRFDFSSPVVDHVVGGGEVALLERVLGGAVPGEEMMLNTTFAVNHGSVVVVELSLRRDHLSGLRCVVIHSGGSSQVESCGLLGNANASVFLYYMEMLGEPVQMIRHDEYLRVAERAPYRTCLPNSCQSGLQFYMGSGRHAREGSNGTFL